MGSLLILIQIGEANFLTLIGRLETLTLIMVGKEDSQNPQEYRMKVDIPSFSGNLDIESFLDWIYEVDKFFDMAYVLREKQVKLWRTNSKEEQPHGGIICKSYEGVKESNP